MRACIAILPLLAACASKTLYGPTADTGSATDTAMHTDTGGVADSAAPPTVQPVWFQLNGTLQITAGAPVADGSTLEITFRGSDGSTGAASSQDTGTVATLPCTLDPTITAITSEDATDPSVTLGWWSFTLPANDDESCPWVLPPGLHLGIGDLDPALDAAMALAGLQVDGSQLDGLYVQYGTNPLWVFGVAGTDAQYAGTAATVPTAPPLPDGLYTLQGLHLLPYASN